MTIGHKICFRKSNQKGLYQSVINDNINLIGILSLSFYIFLILIPELIIEKYWLNKFFILPH